MSFNEVSTSKYQRPVPVNSQVITRSIMDGHYSSSDGNSDFIFYGKRYNKESTKRYDEGLGVLNKRGEQRILNIDTDSRDVAMTSSKDGKTMIIVEKRISGEVRYLIYNRFYNKYREGLHLQLEPDLGYTLGDKVSLDDSGRYMATDLRGPFKRAIALYRRLGPVFIQVKIHELDMDLEILATSVITKEKEPTIFILGKDLDTGQISLYSLDIQNDLLKIKYKNILPNELTPMTTNPHLSIGENFNFITISDPIKTQFSNGRVILLELGLDDVTQHILVSDDPDVFNFGRFTHVDEINRTLVVGASKDEGNIKLTFRF